MIASFMLEYGAKISKLAGLGHTFSHVTTTTQAKHTIVPTD